MGLKTFGLMAVDWEERVNLERLRQDRLNRIKAALKKSELGSLLCFDMNNIRYITATHIGTWAMDKLVRFSSSSLIFFATSSAKPEDGLVAPRNVEMPARERSPSHGQ